LVLGISDGDEFVETGGDFLLGYSVNLVLELSSVSQSMKPVNSQNTRLVIQKTRVNAIKPKEEMMPQVNIAVSGVDDGVTVSHNGEQVMHVDSGGSKKAIIQANSGDSLTFVIHNMWGAWKANFLVVSEGKILFQASPSNPDLLQGPSDPWSHTIIIP